MCASYGLGSGSTFRDDLEPMSEQGNRELLADWAAERRGRATITGRNALNLNPIIVERDNRRTLQLAWWWIWLDGTGPVRFSAFNSRDDRLLRSWKGAFQHRAILPATWYVEKKVRFSLPDDELFGIAAVTSTVRRDDGSDLVTYSMVTREAVGEAAGTWPRMPLVLPREVHDKWLDPDREGDAGLITEARHASDEISRGFAAD